MVPKISVIVPVYKAEAYINKCVDHYCPQFLVDSSDNITKVAH